MIVPTAYLADLAAVAAHYDDLDDLYRSFWGTSLHHGYWITGRESNEEAVANLTRLVAQRAEMKSGENVCDLGCGYGAAAALWQREFGVDVTGITISAKQHRYGVAAVANPHVRLIHGDALASGLAAASFDVVTAVESSEHMADKGKFLLEVKRLLRSGGRCVITAWLTRDRPGTWETRFLLEPICREGRLPNMVSGEEYRGMLSAAGFRAMQYEDLTSRVRKTWGVIARRVGARLLRDPSFRRLLNDPQFTNRVFARTVFRIWLAYRIGAMRFGLFSAVK